MSNEEEQSIFRCQTCKNTKCDFSPANPEAYFLDTSDNKKKIYPGIEVVHEFTMIKGCARHSDFIEPLNLLEKEIKEGQVKYHELVNYGGEPGKVYAIALEALTVCLGRIEKHRKTGVVWK
jgi:hypothetical protein